ncbi:MAG: LacI family DNA-binding transcriptional regulator [Propionibacteriaceae bacterium]|nr:LacI family DNA-binding transcriptional regulator [Propionibacteriaceae bacterium]
MISARDVAEAAGVSVSTVSRALSSPDQVAHQTRERVRAAAAALGYRPNPTAQGLRMGRNHALGLIVPDLENPFFASITKGTQARAQRAGYVLVVTDTNEDLDAETDMAVALAQRTDGLLLCSPRSDDATVARLAERLPTVVINRLVPGVTSIAGDDADGARQALGHLRALGHRRIAVAAGPVRSWSGGRRAASIQAAAETAGDVDLIELGHFPPYFSGGFAAADYAVANGVTAVLAFNDLMAVGLISRLRSRGVRVPHDISVIGCDDISIARLVDPALTTIRVSRTTLSSRAVDLLVSSLDEPSTPSHHQGEFCLPVELVIRDSTREPAVPQPADRLLSLSVP